MVITDVKNSKEATMSMKLLPEIYSPSADESPVITGVFRFMRGELSVVQLVRSSSYIALKKLIPGDWKKS